MDAPSGAKEGAKMTDRLMIQTDDDRAAWPRDIGLHGWTAVTWAMAGGLLLGGVLVAAMTLAGKLSGHGLFITATGLFVVGAAIGLVHGTVLGWFGRPGGVAPRAVRRDLLLAALYTIPALAVAWLATIWIALTMVSIYLGEVGPLVGTVAGWAIGAVVVGSAALTGFRALRNAYARWPERATGTVLVAATFAALLVTFLVDRPALWGVRFRVTEVGGVLLAAAVSIWIVGPIVTLALRWLRQLPEAMRPSIGLRHGWGGVADAAIGLLVGGIVGLLAVPYAVPAVAPGAVGTVVAQVSQALVNELLLRLVLVTGAAWLLLRWHDLHREEVAVVTVVVATVFQGVLYTPAILGVGFPSMIAATAFAITAVLLPAIAFGVLYWTRGFSTAVLADAACAVILLILST
jgi:hypothetical protein